MRLKAISVLFVWPQAKLAENCLGTLYEVRARNHEQNTYLLMWIILNSSKTRKYCSYVVFWRLGLHQIITKSNSIPCALLTYIENILFFYRTYFLDKLFSRGVKIFNRLVKSEFTVQISCVVLWWCRAMLPRWCIRPLKWLL